MHVCICVSVHCHTKCVTSDHDVSELVIANSLNVGHKNRDKFCSLCPASMQPCDLDTFSRNDRTTSLATLSTTPHIHMLLVSLVTGAEYHCRRSGTERRADKRWRIPD